MLSDFTMIKVQTIFLNWKLLLLFLFSVIAYWIQKNPWESWHSGSHPYSSLYPFEIQHMKNTQHMWYLKFCNLRTLVTKDHKIQQDISLKCEKLFFPTAFRLKKALKLKARITGKPSSSGPWGNAVLRLNLVVEKVGVGRKNLKCLEPRAQAKGGRDPKLWRPSTSFSDTRVEAGGISLLNLSCSILKPV